MDENTAFGQAIREQTKPGQAIVGEPIGEAAAPQPRYRPIETLFAWLLLPFGYLFVQLFPMSRKPLAGVLLILAIYAFTFLAVLRGRCRFERVTVLVLLSAALAMLVPLIWDNQFHVFLCFCYLIAAYAYLLSAVTGNTLEEIWSELIGRDLLRAWFVLPFSSFGKLFGALALPTDKGIWRVVLKLLIGLVLAVIPTYVVFLLLSFDSSFTELIGSLFRFRFERPAEIVARVIFAVPVAMYLFGLYCSSVSGRVRREGEAKRIRERSEARRVLPLLSAAAAVGPLLIVYLIFFVSQWDYYVSAFTGRLPAHLSYAEYAREGFFQLCAVAFLNFLVLLALSRYVRNGHKRLRRALCVTIALFTLVLIATAISKLWLYVDQYALTPDRVHAAWFMLLLTILFVLVLVKQFCPRFKALPVALAVTVALFLLLALSGSNRWIARYNVDRCLSGENGNIDVYSLSRLGDDAVPEMLRLEEHFRSREHPDAFTRSKLDLLSEQLRQRADSPRSFWEQSFSSLRAERLLEKNGYR